MPLISVIVPVYKAEKYLCRCIDSILAQTYTDFELLLIDDGSPDRSGEICDEYAKQDSRVRVFHKPNGGVSSARNMGLDNARGEWVTFVDADDQVLLSFFQQLIEKADADWILGGYIETIGVNSLITDKLYQGNDIIDFCNNYNGVHILRSCWGGLYRTSIIRSNDIRFSRQLHYAEDTVFNLAYLTYCCSVRTICELGYIYHNDMLFEDKYILSKDEINRTLNMILYYHELIETKYIGKIVNDADAQIFLNKYPLDGVRSDEGMLAYYSLCLRCYPNVSWSNFYSDERCSPIIHLITSIKRIYEQGRTDSIRENIVLASRICENINKCPQFKFYDFYIWYFLLKYRKYVLLHFLMNTYCLLKKLFK